MTTGEKNVGGVNFGDFFEGLSTADIPGAAELMRRVKGATPAEVWLEFAGMSLNDLALRNLVGAVHSFIKEDLEHATDHEVHDEIYSNGRTFLVEIGRLASELGVELDFDISTTPLTLRDHMTQLGFVAKVGAGIIISEAGYKLIADFSGVFPGELETAPAEFGLADIGGGADMAKLIYAFMAG
jgi:hypothetical protein